MTTDDTKTGIESESFVSMTRHAKEVGLLSKSQLYHLVELAHKGDDEAKNEIVEHNILLVLDIARQLVNENTSFDIEDAFCEGITGLYKAIDHFDTSMHYAFSTYATYWVKREIVLRMKQNGRMIRVPFYWYDQYKLIKQQMDIMGTENVKMIAESLGFTVKQVNDVVQHFKPITSLNAEVKKTKYLGDDAVTCLIDIVASNAITPEDAAVKQDLRDNVQKALENLTERERIVVKRRNGIECDEPETLQQVGNELGVTRERIRQIEAKAYQKLRKNLAVYAQDV